MHVVLVILILIVGCWKKQVQRSVCLCKKRFILFLFIALLGSQNLCAMDNNNADTGGGADLGSIAVGLGVGAVCSVISYFWGKGDGEAGKDRVILIEERKHFDEVQDMREKNLKIERKNFNELHGAKMEILDLKRFGFGKKALVGAVGIVVVYKGGQYLIKKYCGKRAEMIIEAEKEFNGVDPQIRLTYNSLKKSLQKIEKLFVSEFKKQKNEYLEKLKELELFLKDFEGMDNERWTDMNLKWASEVVKLCEDLKEKIEDSILDENKIKEVCKIIDQLLVEIGLFTENLKGKLPEEQKKVLKRP